MVEKNIKVMAIASLVIGIIFILSDDYVLVPAFVLVIGLLALVKSVTILISKPSQNKAMIEWVAAAPDTVLRLWGALAAGLSYILWVMIL
jgi:uncharacterized protein YjeT (DUF2065 family)